MDQHGKNKLKMYKAVAAVCAAQQADWSSLPAFANAYLQFVAKLNELEQAAYNQSLVTAGVTASKEQVLTMTIAKAEVVVNALRAFAAVKNDVLLTGQLKFAKSDFKRGGSQVVLQLTDRILSKAGEHVMELADYGIAPTDIADLTALRLQLGETIGAPRNAIVERKQETQAIRDLMAELDNLLKNHLDCLVEVLKPMHKTFCKRFQNARVIVDYKGKTNEPGDDGGDLEEEGAR